MFVLAPGNNSLLPLQTYYIGVPKAGGNSGVAISCRVLNGEGKTTSLISPQELSNCGIFCINYGDISALPYQIIVVNPRRWPDNFSAVRIYIGAEEDVLHRMGPITAVVHNAKQEHIATLCIGDVTYVMTELFVAEIVFDRLARHVRVACPLNSEATSRQL